MLLITFVNYLSEDKSIQWNTSDLQIVLKDHRTGNSVVIEFKTKKQTPSQAVQTQSV